MVAGGGLAPARQSVPEEVQDAIRTQIHWSGDNPDSEVRLDTPARLGRAWRESCQGYAEDPAVHLSRVIREISGYDEAVLLTDIPFQSRCERHIAPIIGKASTAYLPRDHVVGISKLSRATARRCPAAADPRVADRGERAIHLGQAEATGGRRDDRGAAWLQGRPRGAHAGRGHDPSKLMGTLLEDQSSGKEALGPIGY